MLPEKLENPSTHPPVEIDNPNKAGQLIRNPDAPTLVEVENYITKSEEAINKWAKREIMFYHMAGFGASALATIACFYAFKHNDIGPQTFISDLQILIEANIFPLFVFFLALPTSTRSEEQRRKRQRDINAKNYRRICLKF